MVDVQDDDSGLDESGVPALYYLIKLIMGALSGKIFNFPANPKNPREFDIVVRSNARFVRLASISVAVLNIMGV